MAQPDGEAGRSSISIDALLTVAMVSISTISQLLGQFLHLIGPIEQAETFPKPRRYITPAGKHEEPERGLKTGKVTEMTTSMRSLSGGHSITDGTCVSINDAQRIPKSWSQMYKEPITTPREYHANHISFRLSILGSQVIPLLQSQYSTQSFGQLYSQRPSSTLRSPSLATSKMLLLTSTLRLSRCVALSPLSETSSPLRHLTLIDMSSSSSYSRP